MNLDADTRAGLLGAKLAGIAKSRAVAGASEGVRGPLPGGATLTLPDGAGMVLMADEPRRALGAALTWATRAGIRTGQGLTLVVDVDGDGHTQKEAAEELAWKVKGLSAPPTVWWVDGSSVEPAKPADVPTGPFTVPAEAAPAVAAAAKVEADVVPHADGLVTFEVLGLEVARCWPDASAPDGLAFKVGVGKHDREATDELHEGRPDAAAMARAAAAVRAGRRADVMPGPPALLARERWMRAVLQADPSPLGDGIRDLHNAHEPYPPGDLRRPHPAAAVAGDGTLVVCSCGVDLDLVGGCAASWLLAGRPARAIVVVPEGDDRPITRQLLDRLAFPADLVTVRPPWVE